MSATPVQLAAQADLVLLTADMLRAPMPRPAKEQVLQFQKADGKPDWTRIEFDQLEALLEAADLVTSSVRPNCTTLEALLEVVEQVRALSLDDWSDEYWRLFDSSMACPINEAAYIRRDKGAILGDLAGFYHAFGWRHLNTTGERPDHLLTQLEFVAMLLASGAAAENTEHMEVVSSGLEKFAQAHLQDWIPSFCGQLCDATRLAYFGAVSNWTMILWESLCATHKWPVELHSERLAPEKDQENPYECAANGLVQLGAH